MLCLLCLLCLLFQPSLMRLRLLLRTLLLRRQREPVKLLGALRLSELLAHLEFVHLLGVALLLLAGRRLVSLLLCELLRVLL